MSKILKKLMVLSLVTTLGLTLINCTNLFEGVQKRINTIAKLANATSALKAKVKNGKVTVDKGLVDSLRNVKTALNSAVKEKPNKARRRVNARVLNAQKNEINEPRLNVNQSKNKSLVQTALDDFKDFLKSDGEITIAIKDSPESNEFKAQAEALINEIKPLVRKIMEYYEIKLEPMLENSEVAQRYMDAIEESINELATENNLTYDEDKAKKLYDALKKLKPDYVFTISDETQKKYSKKLGKHIAKLRDYVKELKEKGTVDKVFQDIEKFIASSEKKGDQFLENWNLTDKTKKIEELIEKFKNDFNIKITETEEPNGSMTITVSFDGKIPPGKVVGLADEIEEALNDLIPDEDKSEYVIVGEREKKLIQELIKFFSDEQVFQAGIQLPPGLTQELQPIINDVKKDVVEPLRKAFKGYLEQETT